MCGCVCMCVCFVQNVYKIVFKKKQTENKHIINIIYGI